MQTKLGLDIYKKTKLKYIKKIINSYHNNNKNYIYLTLAASNLFCFRIAIQIAKNQPAATTTTTIISLQQAHNCSI